jgi:two-component system chemotaxis response regulator CheY
MFNLDTHILIVDDMLTMRKLVKKACSVMGFSNFTEAADGAEAYQKLQEASTPIQLIISDWNMPKCTGLDFLKRVRADGRYKDLPFVLLTAEAEIHQVKAAVEAGVSNYVIKPFTPGGLKTKLEQVHAKVTTGKVD